MANHTNAPSLLGSSFMTTAPNGLVESYPVDGLATMTSSPNTVRDVVVYNPSAENGDRAFEYSDEVFSTAGMKPGHAPAQLTFMQIVKDTTFDCLMGSMKALRFSRSKSDIPVQDVGADSISSSDLPRATGAKARRLQRTYAMRNIGDKNVSSGRFNPYPTAARFNKKSTLRRVGAAYGKEELWARIAEEYGTK